MAKRSVWIWVGVAGGIAFLLFALCVCSVAGYAFFSAQREAEAKKQVERARPLISDADAVLKEVEAMSTVSPSSGSAAKSALASAAGLPSAKTKLTEAKTYLKAAGDVGVSGDIEDYIQAKLASTELKLEIVDLRERQKPELAKAAKAAASIRSAYSLLDKASHSIDDAVPLRNKDQFTKADSLRRKGARMLAQSLTLYTSARRTYPSGNFNSTLAYIAKLRSIEQYEAKLDSLGRARRFVEYNRIVSKANSTRSAASKLWNSASSNGTAATIDNAYAREVRDMLDRIANRTSSANAKDSEAEAIWSSMQP
ncbi:MAG: hypothetical protein C4521_02850 [Actinobacteria bacterium]|nr:MAG: hypothetical protein C4521_02850 [Actinomycetota bacterium]